VLALAVGSLLLLCACEEPLGPLSPSTVDAITTMQGDAEGFDRSGQYWVSVELEDCGCDQSEMEPGRPGAPMINGFAAYSLCEAVRQSSPDLLVPIEVLATDGVVTFSAHQAAWAELVGPLWDGGQFSAGSVTSLETFAAKGRLVTRIDGDFDRTDIGHDFEATVMNRIAGETRIDALSQRIDCVEELGLAGSLP
jgi:hypothetical protein